MIVDTSVLLSIVLSEPDRLDLVHAMRDADRRALSTASYVEAGLKLVAVGKEAVPVLDRLVADLELTLVDVTAEQAREAVRARARFGGAPAHLNFGDCLVYALARTTGEPLLSKGDGFIHTDIARVL